MRRLILPLAVCIACALALGAMARPVQNVSSTRMQLASSGCTNIWQNNPIVIYNIEGATFLDVVHSNLIVYSSGSVTFTSSSTAATDGGTQTSFSVDPLVARQLQEDLANAGAATACDGIAAGSDIPLTTVTLFGGANDAGSHTFSFFDNFENPVFQDVQNILGAFIANL